MRAHALASVCACACACPCPCVRILLTTSLLQNRTPREALESNMDLDSFRGRAILYGAAGKKVLTDFAGADDVIKIGLTKTTRSAADRVNDYVRNGCVNAGVVHFLFDDDSYGVLIPFHAKAFETVVHFLVRRRIAWLRHERGRKANSHHTFSRLSFVDSDLQGDAPLRRRLQVRGRAPRVLRGEVLGARGHGRHAGAQADAARRVLRPPTAGVGEREH